MPNPKRAHVGAEQPGNGTEVTPLPLSLTINEAAHELRVTRKTINELMRSGRLGAVRIGPRNGAVRIPRAELVRYITEAQAWEPAS